MIPYVALGLALLAVLPALTIPFVMPNSALAIMRLVASEVTPWLIALALVAGGLALVTIGQGGTISRLALGLAVLTLVLAAIPLARAPIAARDAERQLTDAFGPHPSGARPPFSPLTTLVGLRSPAVTVERDREFPIEGATLRLDRYALGDGARRPAMVVVHGGSWQAGDKGDGLTSNSEWSRIFAARGYVVYDVQYRLAPADPHPAAMRDVLCALAHIRTHADRDGVDPERVILLGRSAGAHLALLAGYRAASGSPCGATARVAGVIALYGPTDLLGAYAFPGDPDLIGGRSVLRSFLGGTPDEVRERYVDAMPRTWLAGAVPTLLIHGEADPIVYPRHAEDLYSRLRERGVPAVYLRLPWSGHGFDLISVGLGGQIALSVAERFAGAVVRERE